MKLFSESSIVGQKLSKLLSKSTHPMSPRKHHENWLLSKLDHYSGVLLQIDSKKVTSTCVDHSSKRSKYYSKVFDAKMNVHVGLCSKCSVACAMKGVKLIEIKLSPKEHKRQGLNLFLDQLDATKQELDQRIELIVLLDKGLLKSLRSGNDIIEDYIQKSIEKMREIGRILKTKFEAISNNSMQTIIDFTEKLKQQRFDLESISNDIKNNNSLIIEEVEILSFEQIIQDYFKRLSYCKSQIRETSNIILPSLNLQGVVPEFEELIKQVNFTIGVDSFEEFIASSNLRPSESAQSAEFELIRERSISYRNRSNSRITHHNEIGENHFNKQFYNATPSKNKQKGAKLSLDCPKADLFKLKTDTNVPGLNNPESSQ